MTSLIDQLYDIAHNAEFSEDQRKSLMQIALDEAGETDRIYPLIKITNDPEIMGRSPTLEALEASRYIGNLARQMGVPFIEDGSNA